jgi:hypothetical protein
MMGAHPRPASASASTPSGRRRNRRPFPADPRSPDPRSEPSSVLPASFCSEPDRVPCQWPLGPKCIWHRPPGTVPRDSTPSHGRRLARVGLRLGVASQVPGRHDLAMPTDAQRRERRRHEPARTQARGLALIYAPNRPRPTRKYPALPGVGSKTLMIFVLSISPC